MSNIVEYLPEYIKNIKDFKKITEVEDIELSELSNKIDEIIEEVDVQTASSYGLTKYEYIFNIKNYSTDEDERRFKIKSKMNNQLPYNMTWLENKLKNLVGTGNYTINLDTSNYSITIFIAAIFPDIAELMNNDLRKQLPANLLITVNLFQTEKNDAYMGGFVHVGDIMKVEVS